MKRSLYTKLLACYAAIGIFCFFLVTAGGSFLIERHLETSTSKKLYRVASTIADNEVIKHNISSANLDSIREALASMAGYQDSLIWILNNKGEVVVSTRKEISPDTPINIKKFDPATSKGTYYFTGDFFGYFHEDYLSVIAPITADMTTKGYVCIHYLMSYIYQTRASFLTILQVLSLIIYLSMFFLLLLYHRMVQKPLGQISRGASEYA
ncbi:Signal transduction histidine kinase, partial [gut metagenome]